MCPNNTTDAIWPLPYLMSVGGTYPHTNVGPKDWRVKAGREKYADLKLRTRSGRSGNGPGYGSFRVANTYDFFLNPRGPI